MSAITYTKLADEARFEAARDLLLPGRPDYEAPFPFTGKPEKITFDLGETLMTPEAIRAMIEELAKKRDR